MRASVALKEEIVISNPIEIRVAPPRGYEQEYFAQDFFSNGVAAALVFGGDERTFTVATAEPERAADLLTAALMKSPAAALETFGGIGYARSMKQLAALLEGMVRKQEAEGVRKVVAG
ncbi:MAG: hypothetical protein JST22_02820 [Bacteroidetes bacterium]|nr:hypothetical protein [Bacteroidota bacterium]